MDRSDVPDAFYNRVENFKIRGSSGKLNIALDGLPEFPALPKETSLYISDMHFIDSMERMERAYDDWKAGTWSKDPYVDMVIPTLVDPTMAPPGKHFMSCFIQYCPHKIEGRDWTDPEREASRKQSSTDRELQPQLQGPDPALRGQDATGHRGPDRHHRRQHLLWRTDDGPAVVQTGPCGPTRNTGHRLQDCTCADQARTRAVRNGSAGRKRRTGNSCGPRPHQHGTGELWR